MIIKIKTLVFCETLCVRRRSRKMVDHHMANMGVDKNQHLVKSIIHTLKALFI